MNLLVMTTHHLPWSGLLETCQTWEALGRFERWLCLPSLEWTRPQCQRCAWRRGHHSGNWWKQTAEVYRKTIWYQLLRTWTSMKPWPLDRQKNLTVPVLTLVSMRPDIDWVRVRRVTIRSGSFRPSGRGDPTTLSGLVLMIFELFCWQKLAEEMAQVEALLLGWLLIYFEPQLRLEVVWANKNLNRHEKNIFKSFVELNCNFNVKLLIFVLM